MIDDWRMAFHQGSGGQTEDHFPFGFVQVSGTGLLSTSPFFSTRFPTKPAHLQLCTFIKDSKDLGYPEIRWHQTANFGFAPNQRMRKTFMAVALDLPDESLPYDP